LATKNTHLFMPTGSVSPPEPHDRSHQSLAVALPDRLEAGDVLHFAWPGYGHIAQTGDGFHYYHYPEPMQMLL
jgi:hypothetical protein